MDGFCGRGMRPTLAKPQPQASPDAVRQLVGSVLRRRAIHPHTRNEDAVSLIATAKLITLIWRQHLNGERECEHRGGKAGGTRGSCRLRAIARARFFKYTIPTHFMVSKEGRPARGEKTA